MKLNKAKGQARNGKITIRNEFYHNPEVQAILMYKETQAAIDRIERTTVALQDKPAKKRKSGRK